MKFNRLGIKKGGKERVLPPFKESELADGIDESLFSAHRVEVIFQASFW